MDGARDSAVESGASSAEDAGDREVITTGSLTVVVTDALAAVEDVVGLVDAAAGRIDERSQQNRTEHSPASAWLTVRVPSDGLTALIDELEQVGEVTDVSISAQDVTRQGQDLDARITALQASTDRLLELMVEADSTETLLQVETALSERQGELESLQSQRTLLSEQVAMSTLHVSIVSEETAQLETDGFIGGLKNGWHSLVAFASGLLVVAGTLLPWLAVIGVPLAVVVVLVRRSRRRRVPVAGSAPITDSTPPSV